MWGRFAISRSDDEIAAAFGATVVGASIEPSAHVEPLQSVRVVLEHSLPWADREQDGPGRSVRQMRTVRWGLVPFWANDPKIGTRLINAASESITEKAAFRRAAASRRCILPVDGFYASKPEKRDGQTSFLHADDQMLTIAGLYELWAVPARHEDDADRWLWTMAVVTTTVVDTNGGNHDRTPMVLPTVMIDDWLDPQLTDLSQVRRLVAAVPNPDLISTPAAGIVGSAPGDGQEPSPRRTQLPTQRRGSTRWRSRRESAALRSRRG